MFQAASGILKIIIFLFIGILFKQAGILREKEIAGIKKVVLYLAIPSVLFLSFSRLVFDLSFIPVTAAVFGINLILFLLGILIFRVTGSKNRLIPLCISTMNFALIGIPLYESVFGIEYLHYYTRLGVGNEIFVWFVFYFIFRWFLSKGRDISGINTGFIKSPVVWGIILGCIFSILGIDLSVSRNFAVQGFYQALNGLAALTTPLILIFVGFNISVSTVYLRSSLRLVLLRLAAAFGVGYLIKLLVINRFIPTSAYADTAYFLLIILPPIFALPILASDYLEDEELVLLNNTIVIHSLVTIAAFAIYSFFLH